MSRLIITNGDMAAERVLAEWPDVTVLPWRDVLHDGPLVLHKCLQEQSKERAAFIAEFADMSPDQVTQDFQARDQLFLKAADYDRVELWFEHDLYDQLQLLQILYFANLHMPDVALHLVQADFYLCELADEEFASLPECASQVTTQQRAYANACWLALMNGQSVEGEPTLPYVAKALDRFEKEKGDIPLSLVYAARPLMTGSASVLDMFKAMQSAEDAKFMGDLSFYHMVKRYLVGEDALFKGDFEEGMEYRAFFDLELELTALGRQTFISS